MDRISEKIFRKNSNVNLTSTNVCNLIRLLILLIN